MPQSRWVISVTDSLRKRYQKSIREDDRKATMELFKEAVYLGIDICNFD